LAGISESSIVYEGHLAKRFFQRLVLQDLQWRQIPIGENAVWWTLLNLDGLNDLEVTLAESPVNKTGTTTEPLPSFFLTPFGTNGSMRSERSRPGNLWVRRTSPVNQDLYWESIELGNPPLQQDLN